MTPTLSPAARAVVSLMGAQRHVAARFDGSWWPLDAAKWELIATLRGPEHTFILSLVNHYAERTFKGVA